MFGQDGLTCGTCLRTSCDDASITVKSGVKLEQNTAIEREAQTRARAVY